MIGGNHRVIGQRYGDRHPRTVKRWIERGEFPAPDLVINNRPYWHAATLDAFDRRRAASTLSQPRARQPAAQQSKT